MKESYPKCKHRGEYDKHVMGDCPQGNALPAFICEIGDLCTLMRKADDASIQCCRECPHREPPK